MSSSGNFYTYIFQSLLTNPDKIFICWKNQDFDGATILTRIEIFRTQLKFQNIKTGDRILIASSFNADTFFMILAIMAHGATPVLPPSKVHLHEIAKLFRSKSISWVSLKKNHFLTRIILFCFQLKPIVHSKMGMTVNNKVSSPCVVPLKQPAFVTHSSGSTGIPKSISRSHSVLSAQHAVLKEVFPVITRQRDFPLFPAILLHNLACGITTIVPEIPGFNIDKIDFKRIVTQLCSQKITTLTGNVYYFKKLLKNNGGQSSKFSSVLALGIGGSPVPEYLLHELKIMFCNATIYCIYGSSEAEPIAIRKIENIIAPQFGFCVGKLAPGVLLKIDNKTGEILVRGNHVVIPENSEWYSTGDFGKLHDGSLYLTARQGNEKSIKGIRHYQIENVLLNLSGVDNVAAIARFEYFEIYIISNISEQEIRQETSKYFPEHSIGPIRFRTNLPVDKRHRSKIIYNQIK